jgi:glutamate--cysteine ligase
MINEFQLPGYEDLELSTQLVIREALARDHQVEVLDRSDNFIRVTGNGKSELLKQASKAACDSYMTFLIMENKAVTKQILDEHGIRVPKGGMYTDPAEAFKAIRFFNFSRTVIKPKTTNFGIGISFVNQSDKDEVLRAAIAGAFEHDHSILIEEFLTGTEYRFLTIGDKTIGITLRVPANVVGDGEHSIAELVEIKNQDPRRGENYLKPLEKIRLDETECGILADQGLTPDAVPAAREQIFLRHNSNMSTGGDTLDYTDQVHQGYKDLAVRSAHAADASICGVDLLIPDISVPPTEDNYGVVELNFNPILLIHDYPYEGENRKSGAALLDFLGL